MDESASHPPNTVRPSRARRPKAAALILLLGVACFLPAWCRRNYSDEWESNGSVIEGYFELVRGWDTNLAGLGLGFMHLVLLWFCLRQLRGRQHGAKTFAMIAYADFLAVLAAFGLVVLSAFALVSGMMKMGLGLWLWLLWLLATHVFVIHVFVRQDHEMSGRGF